MERYLNKSILVLLSLTRAYFPVYFENNIDVENICLEANDLRPCFLCQKLDVSEPTNFCLTFS